MTWIIGADDYSLNEHITDPRPAWWAGAEGDIRRIERLLRYQMKINDALHDLNNGLRIEFRDGRDGVRYIIRFKDGSSLVYKCIDHGRAGARRKVAEYLHENCPGFMANYFLEKRCVNERCKKRGAIRVSDHRDKHTDVEGA